MSEDEPIRCLSDLCSEIENSSHVLSSYEIRKVCIEELNEHYAWYNRSRNIHALAWRLSMIFMICLSAATTIAVAFGATASTEGRITFGLFSAAATALTTLTATFAMREVWQLRESGRIAISDLLARACLITTEDNKKALSQAYDLLHEAHKIEEAQAKVHFGFLTQQRYRPRAASRPDREAEQG